MKLFSPVRSLYRDFPAVDLFKSRLAKQAVLALLLSMTLFTSAAADEVQSQNSSRIPEDNLSRIGITNEITEHRVQAKIGAMSVELARKKLAESRLKKIAEIRSQFCDQPPGPRIVFRHSE